MNPELIVRAWKEPEFRARLTSEQFQTLPEHPSGKPMTELGDEDLSDVMGGREDKSTITLLTTSATTLNLTNTPNTLTIVIIEGLPSH